MSATNTSAASSGVGRWITLFALLIALGLGVVLGVGPVARSQGWLVEGGSPTPSPGLLDRYREASPAPGPTVGWTPAGAPNADAVVAALASVPNDTDGSFTGWVADVDSGTVLYDNSARLPMIPASSIKVLTTVALLSAVDPESTYRTRVVRNPDGRIVLVGGGDPTLRSEPAPQGSYPAASSTRELAAATASALLAAGGGPVEVGYDDSLFVGPGWNPAWQAGDDFFVGDVAALSIDGNFRGQGRPFSHTPGLDAANAFAQQLVEAGVPVVGDRTPVAADPTASELAGVDSPSVLAIAQDALLNSDNQATEVLSRHLAIALGQPASFEGGAAALATQLDRLGLTSSGQALVDGSGMSRGNRVNAAALGGAIALAAKDPVLAGLIDGLPVGRATGTLRNRFTNPSAASGRGIVTAKTGSLNTIGTLTGYVQTQDGSLLAFSFMHNDVTRGDIRVHLDDLASRLAICGCGSAG